MGAGIRTAEGKKGTSGVEELKAAFTKDPFSIVDEVQRYMRSQTDPTKREDVSLAVGRMVRTARAGGALETLVNTAQEMNNQFSRLDMSTGSVADAQKMLEGSLLLSGARLESAFQGLAGQTVRLVEPGMILAVDAVSKNLSALAEGKIPDLSTALAGTAGAASLAAASMLAVPMGGIAGMTALTTGHGNTNQLLGAIAVNTAATATNTALGGLGGAGSILGKLGARGALGLLFRGIGLPLSGLLGISGLIASQRGTPNAQFQPGRSWLADWLMSFREEVVETEAKKPRLEQLAKPIEKIA